MLNIQEAGKQILSGNPSKFYVFVGDEYGIKDRYLSILKDHYKQYAECECVSDVFNQMKHRSIIPLSPKLYIVRYDEEYIQSLSDRSAEEIETMNIVGTIVCIYQNSKHSTKCCKYLEKYTVQFDPVNIGFIRKYLVSDFPDIDSALIDFAVKIRSDYRGAWNVCNCLKHAKDAPVMRYGDNAVADTFGVQNTSEDDQFKVGIAARDFAYCIHTLESYQGDISMLLYVMLSTMLEIERLMCAPKAKSNLQKYVRSWTLNDVYHMFMHIYSELELSRSAASYDIYDRIVYLLGIMQFSPIPKVGDV